jgi:uracil-DNA glycosylase
VATFDRGYVDEPFATLVDQCPGVETFPAKDFRVEWGPIFHRGRLDGSAGLLVIGQDPGATESFVRRILVGEAGQRLQGFLAKLGISRSYVLVNAFVYSLYGQGGGSRHRHDAKIAAYRNRWLDAIRSTSPIEAVIALGNLAESAHQDWAKTIAVGDRPFFRRIYHPTYPESSSPHGSTAYAAAMQRLLADWNAALDELTPQIKRPDAPPSGARYGTTLTDADRAAIPSDDLPAGLPTWMRSLEPWAQRVGTTPDEKRATLVATVPVGLRPFANDG